MSICAVNLRCQFSDLHAVEGPSADLKKLGSYAWRPDYMYFTRPVHQLRLGLAHDTVLLFYVRFSVINSVNKSAIILIERSVFSKLDLFM